MDPYGPYGHKQMTRRIRNLTQHLMDLKLLAPVPSADRSAEVLRDARWREGHRGVTWIFDGYNRICYVYIYMYDTL